MNNLTLLQPFKVTKWALVREHYTWLAATAFKKSSFTLYAGNFSLKDCIALALGDAYYTQRANQLWTMCTTQYRKTVASKSTFFEFWRSLSWALNLCLSTFDVESDSVVDVPGKDCFPEGADGPAESFIVNASFDLVRRFSTLLSVSVDILICKKCEIKQDKRHRTSICMPCICTWPIIRIIKHLFLRWSVPFIKISPVVWQWHFAENKRLPFVVRMTIFPRISKTKERKILLG